MVGSMWAASGSCLVRSVAWLQVGLVLLLVAAGCSSPGPRLAAGPSPLLLGLNLRDLTHDRWDKVWDVASSLHSGWVRLDGQVALDEKGSLDFGFYDRWVDQFRAGGIGVLGQLGGAKASCARSVAPDNTVNCPPDPGREGAYADYVEKAVEHFAGRITYWQSWNEPDQNRYSLSAADPTAYARVLRIQHDAMKRANPHAKLIFAATSSNNQLWTARVLTALGGDRPYESVALHPYRFSGPREQVPFIGPDGSQVPLDMKSELRKRIAPFRQYDSQHG